MGRYFLNYVHRGPVVAANALVMAAEHAVGRPQREDNIAALGAIVVAAEAVPLGRSQRVEGNGGRLPAFWDAAAPVVPPQHHRQDYDDHKQERAAGHHPHQHARDNGALAAAGLSCSRA